MGCHKNIDYDRFPKQGDQLGKRIRVLYNFAEPVVGMRPEGVCVRDDREEPFLTIFKLDDGRFILSTECQYSEVRG